MAASTKSKACTTHTLKHKKVRIICPFCGDQKVLELPSDCVNKSSPLTSILIQSDTICYHNFVAYLDRDFKIRGTQKIDYIV